ncbi:MAG: lipoyl synthase [Enterobacteriaceae bacterium PSpicST2]|nr:MAG: lipoyl synthase [Enterobacteriaceae bacterium PSpicST2]
MIIKKKPKWIKIKIPKIYKNINKIKNIFNKNKINSVCKEAICPNLYKCFNKGIATFMILGNICTRNCNFCNIKKGKPLKINFNEPIKIFKIVKYIKLKYVVITSVNRDDLIDGGAKHFYNCIKYIKNIKNIKIEILVPDFRNCMNNALKIFNFNTPNIFNHNLETIFRIYNKILPDSKYKRSLKILRKFKNIQPKIPVKSGLMLGLGEQTIEILYIIYKLRNIGVNIITLGQYLQPSYKHQLVKKYITPIKFNIFKTKALKMGYNFAFCGVFIRSSYNANFKYNNYKI